LCAKNRWIAHEDEGYEGETEYAPEASDQPHRSSFPAITDFELQDRWNTRGVHASDAAMYTMKLAEYKSVIVYSQVFLTKRGGLGPAPA
jgi:hypothetical protein